MIEFLKNIIRSKAAESSKRFVALLTFALITYVTFRYTTKDNAVQVLTILTSFVLSLLVVASYENIKGKKDEKNQVN